MNHGIAFARTVRSLDADDFRGSKIASLLAAIVILAWVWWLFAPRIPQYEVSKDIRFDPLETRSAIAFFPVSIEGRIQSGQIATFHTGTGMVPAQVTGVSFAAGAPVRVELRYSRPVVATVQATEVDVVVERVAPITIALRAA